MKLFGEIAVGVFLVVFICGVAVQGRDLAPKDSDKDEEKLTIKQVMAKAHKPPANLLRNVAQGKATTAQKGELLKLYQALAKNAPPKGDKEKWAERTKLLVTAAEAAVKGEADAGKQLTKASDCMTCHKAHK